MPEQIRTMSAAELRGRWRDTDQEKFVREEALWEYWRRVAEGALPYSDEELLEALSLDNARIPDVLGLLAKHDLLAGDSLREARRFQAKLKDDGWLAAQLDAREMLGRLKAGERPDWLEVCEALVAKGTVWAALEAVPLLRPDEAEALVLASEQSRVFTKGQRHDLRVRASKFRAK